MAEAGLTSYSSDVRRYDELLDAAGEVRTHWRPLVDRLASDGAEAVRRGVELARRLIVENGVTYNVYADPQGRARPWVLDPLPLLLTAAEWREIEAGVTQRAHLLDALLADLYGPQELLAAGIIPAELPFGHPNFLWPSMASRPPAARACTSMPSISRAPSMDDGGRLPTGRRRLPDRATRSKIDRSCHACSPMP